MSSRKTHKSFFPQTSMSRREFVRLVAAGTAATAFPLCGSSSPSAKHRPNVLFIAVDDLNDWIGCLGGHPDVQTPNIDRLAQRGMLFTNAHCSAPLCNPSRASILTGLLPSTSGIYFNEQPLRKALPDAVTLPEHFKNHGYHVVGTGKVFHGFPNDYPRSWHDYYRPPQNTRPEGRLLDWRIDGGPLDIPDDEMGDALVANWAVDQLRRKHDAPFFLAVGIFRPHLVWFAPRKYFDMYPPERITLPTVNENDLDDLPPLARELAICNEEHKRVTEGHQWRTAVAAYLACVSFADAMIGRVLDALDRSPYADDTAIVLWGDHGWHLGQKLHWRKFTLWEEATHCPLIVVAPGVTTPGQRCTHPVSLVDIYPTLVDICGLASREELQGSSLLPLLRDPAASWERPALTTYGRNNHSVRSHRWRYIRYEDGTEELYDHQKDELEWTNLAIKTEYAAVKETLTRWLPRINAPYAPDARGRTDLTYFHRNPMFSRLRERRIEFLSNTPPP